MGRHSGSETDDDQLLLELRALKKAITKIEERLIYRRQNDNEDTDDGIADDETQSTLNGARLKSKNKKTAANGPFPVGTVVVVKSKSDVRGKPVVVLETRGGREPDCKVHLGTSAIFFTRRHERWFLNKNLKLATEEVAHDYRRKNSQFDVYWNTEKDNDEQG